MQKKTGQDSSNHNCPAKGRPGELSAESPSTGALSPEKHNPAQKKAAQSIQTLLHVVVVTVI
jgi:hypothetical protein